MPYLASPHRTRPPLAPKVIILSLKPCLAMPFRSSPRCARPFPTVKLNKLYLSLNQSVPLLAVPCLTRLIKPHPACPSPKSNYSIPRAVPLLASPDRSRPLVAKPNLIEPVLTTKILTSAYLQKSACS